MIVNKTKLPGLHIGTSGWSYKHWAGIFYPDDVKPAKYLEYYMTKFDCVELNSIFYHLPKKATVKGWMKRTSDTFKFCTKLSRFITHQKRLADVKSALYNYFDVLEDMQSKLGPILIQLPPGLPYDKSLITHFLDDLKRQYSQYRFAVEVRHQSWMTADFFDLLTQYSIAFVIADSGKRFPYYEAVTTDFVYLRFHGREQLYASDYHEPELKQYAEKIINWLNDDKKAVWAFFNNDYNGFAVKNATQLQEMVYTNCII